MIAIVYLYVILLQFVGIGSDLLQSDLKPESLLPPCGSGHVPLLDNVSHKKKGSYDDKPMTSLSWLHWG